MNNQEYESIKGKLDFATFENKKLVKSNKKLKKENGHLRRIIKKLKDELALVENKKPQYKNSKRGMRRHG